MPRYPLSGNTFKWNDNAVLCIFFYNNGDGPVICSVTKLTLMKLSRVNNFILVEVQKFFRTKRNVQNKIRQK